MLEFFRKYQRIFFIFVTVVIIVTFSLFGSYKTMNQTESRKDIVVGHAIDGSKLKYSEIKQLSALLGAESGKTGVLGKEFLQTGAAEHLAAAFAGTLKADWQSRLERAKRCRFYVHPAAPSLNAQDIYNQLAPGVIDEVRALQSSEELQPGFFASWSHLFLLQEQCPGELMRRILLYHERQNQIPRDPHILNEDFSLCGFRGAHEWFGANFLDLVSQFVLNGAIQAEEKGYQATKAEAEADLLQRFSYKDASLETVLHSIGVMKSDAVELWQRTLLFLRYFRDVGQSVLVDDLPYRRFADFANETAKLDVYHLPAELQFHSIDDFLSFEVYARLACRPYEILSLPTQLLDVAEVEKEAPELVSTLYRMKSQEIDLRKIGARLSMREVWDWQLEKSHWEALLAAFPEINNLNGKDNFQKLEKLDPDRRAAIDDWSRRQIVEQHPDWIENELMAAPIKECEAAIFANGEIDGMPIRSVSAFQGLLEKACGSDREAIDILYRFREEGQSEIRRITSVEKIADRTILSFADAKKKGRIKVDRFLDERRPPHGADWKPFGEIREDLIRQTFGNLFSAIDDRETGNDWMPGKGPLSFYFSHRFHHLMQEALSSLLDGNSALRCGLWTIEKCERTIPRTSSEEWIMKQPFILKTDQWSDVYVPMNGDIVFFFVKERTVPASPILEQIQHGKETLSNDIQCRLTDSLLAAALKKQAIVLPLKSEKEKNDDL
jgi:hypothetical protein